MFAAIVPLRRKAWKDEKAECKYSRRQLLKAVLLKCSEREDDNYNTKGIFISNLQAGVLSVFFHYWMVGSVLDRTEILKEYFMGLWVFLWVYVLMLFSFKAVLDHVERERERERERADDYMKH